MEDLHSLIEVANRDVKESRKALEQVTNDIQALAEVALPVLGDFVQQMRASRMAAIGEMKEILSTLKDVRRFFLEADYESEMTRLERFVKLCREIQSLKQSGVFDAICDSAIRLAIKDQGGP